MAPKTASKNSSAEKLNTFKSEKLSAYIVKGLLFRKPSKPADGPWLVDEPVYKPIPIDCLSNWQYLYNIVCRHQSAGGSKALAVSNRPRTCGKCAWQRTSSEDRKFLNPHRRIVWLPQCEVERRREEAGKERVMLGIDAASEASQRSKARSKAKAGVSLQDDPIEDGKQLAYDGQVRLPSDLSGNGTRWGGPEKEKLIDVEAEMTMDDILRESSYTVRFARKRRRGRSGAGTRAPARTRVDATEPDSDPIVGEPAIMFEDLVKGQVRFWPGLLGLRLDPIDEDDTVSDAGSWVAVDEFKDVHGVD